MFFGCLVAGIAVHSARAAPRHGSVEEWPVTGLAEPSGIVYHPRLKSLFAVGDEGDVAEIDLAGKLLRVKRIRGDLEAITCDPATGKLYVVREGHEIIFELDPATFKMLRRFDIDRSYKGDPNFLQRGGDGVEGLAFVTDEHNPEGGRFYAVNQYDPPVLVELHLPLRTSKERFERAKVVGAWPIEGAPLSDVTWDSPANGFLIVSALWRSVYIVGADGHKLRSVRIPGFMQEGITRLPDGSFVIAQDTGGLIKWKPDSDPFAAKADDGSDNDHAK